MTTATELIQDAYREGNLIAVGKSPTTSEQTEALARLNSYIRGLFGYEMGENLSDWQAPPILRTASVAANYPQLPSSACSYSLSDVWPYPPANQRIVFGGTENTTVYFPEHPQDGARMAVTASPQATAILTLDGNGRYIGAAATDTFSAPYTAKQWFYRADLGKWVLLADLALTDDSLFPAELDDLFITGLSIRLSSRYGKTIGDGTVVTQTAMLKKFKARYTQQGVTVYGSGNFPPSYQVPSNRGWLR